MALKQAEMAHRIVWTIAEWVHSANISGFPAIRLNTEMDKKSKGKVNWKVIIFPPQTIGDKLSGLWWPGLKVVKPRHGDHPPNPIFSCLRAPPDENLIPWFWNLNIWIVWYLSSKWGRCQCGRDFQRALWVKAIIIVGREIGVVGM